MDDLYETLQVSPNAEPEVIDAAYRVLSRKYHPDVDASPDAKVRQQSLNHAYVVLSDKRRRAEYDRGRASERLRSLSEASTGRPERDAESPSTALTRTASRTPAVTRGWRQPRRRWLPVVAVGAIALGAGGWAAAARLGSGETDSAGMTATTSPGGVPADPSPTSTHTPTPTPSPTPTPTSTPTPTPVPCDQISVRITQLDKRGEIVTLSGTGELTGWAIVSETGGQQFDFPEGFTMSGEVVQVISGRAQFGNTATQLWWTRASVWNNDDPDPALLLCRGNVIQRFGS